MTKEQLAILVNLAASDKHIAESERAIIQMIGKSQHIDEETIDDMLTNPTPMSVPPPLTPDEKFECLYNVVQIMKIDGKVKKEEVVFCENLAENLSYRKGVIAMLSSHIYQDPSITSNRENLKKKADKFVVK